MDSSTDAATDDMAAGLADLARRAAQSAGTLLRDERPAELQVSAKSSPTDVVTQMDRAAEEHLARMILGERPGDGILGEEGGERAGKTGVRWIVDPLDGTTNYAHGFPVFATSVGLLWRGLPLIGALELPALNQSFWAAAGAGAWRSPGPSGPRPAQGQRRGRWPRR